MHHVQALLVGLETLATALPAIVKKYPLMANMNMLAQPELRIPFDQTQCTDRRTANAVQGPHPPKNESFTPTRPVMMLAHGVRMKVYLIECTRPNIRHASPTGSGRVKPKSMKTWKAKP